MRDSDVQNLVCPACRADLAVESAESREGAHVVLGRLRCTGCAADYAIAGGIPRFVPAENYASSFGFEWNQHGRTQYDSHTGLPLSERRFFEETRWPRDLSGQLLLEVGSGSGRFTEQAASTGAFVVSMDYSSAVEANYRSNGQKRNVLIVQGDVYAMPFRRGVFDKLFCFGMLQHTPAVREAFMQLPPMLKPDGEVVVDVYPKTFALTVLGTKYYVRPFTRRMDPNRLYKLTRRWVDLIWPLSTLITRIPKIGHSINWRLLIPDYSPWGLKGQVAKEWAYLDIFDMLAPRYDAPQTLSTLREWFAEAGLTDVEVRRGYNGIEGRGRTPAKTSC